MLKESESMVRQAAQEFESLKEQLQAEKERNKSLLNDLNNAKAKIPKTNVNIRNNLRKNS